MAQFPWEEATRLPDAPDPYHERTYHPRTFREQIQHDENLRRYRVIARNTLERLRVRAYARAGSLQWGLMQRLGNFGRKHAWFMRARMRY